MDWGLYVEGIRRPKVGFSAAWDLAASEAGFVWVGVHAPNLRQLTQLGGILGLHPLALEDAANKQQRPKLVRYDDVVFVSMRTLDYVESDARDEGGDVVETGSIMVFIGEHFALTVRHGRHASVTALRHRLEADPRHLAYGPSAVLHQVADMVVDDYLAVVALTNTTVRCRR
jgi:magnesium transporter